MSLNGLQYTGYINKLGIGEVSPSSPWSLNPFHLHNISEVALVMANKGHLQAIMEMQLLNR